MGKVLAFNARGDRKTSAKPGVTRDQISLEASLLWFSQHLAQSPRSVVDMVVDHLEKTSCAIRAI